MKKIKFESLPSRKSPLSPEILNQLQDNVEKEFDTVKDVLNKHAMTLSLKYSATTVANTYTKVDLSDDIKIGTKLSPHNGGIKIGADVSYVLVNASLAIQNGNEQGTRYLRVIRNNINDLDGNTVLWNTIDGQAHELQIISAGPALVEVTEGDVLYLYNYCREGDKLEGNDFGKRVQLTVEVLERYTLPSDQNWDKLDEFAEEVDGKIEELTNAIQQEQTTQNANISANTENIEKLKAENELLKSQIPTRKSNRSRGKSRRQ